MSLAHMSRAEQLVSLGGLLVLVPVGLLVGGITAGDRGAALGVGLAIAVTMVVKSKMWRPTDNGDSAQRELGEFGGGRDE